MPLQEKRVPLKPNSQKKRRRKLQRKMRMIRNMIRTLSSTLENKLAETKSENSKLISIMPPNSLARPLSVVSFKIIPDLSSLDETLGTSSSELDSLISFQPRTKEDFVQLSDRIIEFVIKRHQTKPLYPLFVEHHARALALPLKDVEVRKVASGLTTLANEKQKEQRDKQSGKKKPKAASKPGLAGAKVSARYVFNYIPSIQET